MNEFEQAIKEHEPLYKAGVQDKYYQGAKWAWYCQQKLIDDLRIISKEQVEVINAWDSRATNLAIDNMFQAKKLFEQTKRIEELEQELKQFYFKASLETIRAVKEALRGEE